MPCNLEELLFVVKKNIPLVSYCLKGLVLVSEKDFFFIKSESALTIILCHLVEDSQTCVAVSSLGRLSWGWWPLFSGALSLLLFGLWTQCWPMKPD